MPAYLYFVTAYGLAIALFGKNLHGSPETFANIAANLVFLAPLAALLVGDGISLGFVPGSWSLTPEMWFYAILPPLARLASWRSFHGILIALLLVFGTVSDSTTRTHGVYVMEAKRRLQCSTAVSPVEAATASIAAAGPIPGSALCRTPLR